MYLSASPPHSMWEACLTLFLFSSWFSPGHWCCHSMSHYGRAVRSVDCDRDCLCLSPSSSTNWLWPWTNNWVLCLGFFTCKMGVISCPHPVALLGRLIELIHVKTLRTCLVYVKSSTALPTMAFWKLNSFWGNEERNCWKFLSSLVKYFQIRRGGPPLLAGHSKRHQ